VLSDLGSSWLQAREEGGWAVQRTPGQPHQQPASRHRHARLLHQLRAPCTATSPWPLAMLPLLDLPPVSALPCWPARPTDLHGAVDGQQDDDGGAVGGAVPQVNVGHGQVGNGCSSRLPANGPIRLTLVRACSKLLHNWQRRSVSWKPLAVMSPNSAVESWGM